ncbi:MAG TPA: ATP-binding protein [Pyrinomonadaceae bacterium]|jgi:signal transduction histidine kinase
MSLLEILQLIGYSMAAALSLWLGGGLLKRRRVSSRLERVLLVLALCMGAWHASNLVLVLHTMLGLADGRWAALLRLADTVAVVSVTLTYSLLLHVHLYLWADARRRPLTRLENVRVYLSYIPALFLAAAVPPLWMGEHAPMYVKLARLLWPFALWATYVLCLTATTDFLIARLSTSPGEKRLMRMLAASFVGIAVLIMAVYIFRVGEGTALGLYLQTLANLGSLLPTALLAYHVYRYRYLELIVRESLIFASFAAVVLVVYLYGIRTFGAWLTERYQLRAGAIETLLILSLALVAAPLRGWLDQRFNRLFEREAALYRDVVTRIGANAGRYRELPVLLRFIEERISTGLNLRRVRLIARSIERNTSEMAGDGTHASFENGGMVVWEESASEAGRSEHLENGERENAGAAKDSADRDAIDGEAADASRRAELAAWAEQLLTLLRAQYWEALEGEELLRGRGFEIAYALRRENRLVGLMLVDAPTDALTRDVRAVLEILAGQVAVAIDDCRLVEENVRLERRLAHGERLAALGQMAATVAHEVKNPLSAIKSIAQVMREDERLADDYTRDLDLIVGETDRLNRSVTQLLSFARRAPAMDAAARVDEVVRASVALFRAEANSRGVTLELNLDSRLETSAEEGRLDGARAAALRDAVSNLLLNALQATPSGGRVSVEAGIENENYLIAVNDGGAGVSPQIRERIWEPFFTTRQRGTGLGLSIVRKRMEEVGGRATLAPAREKQSGARFELRLPVKN